MAAQDGWLGVGQTVGSLLSHTAAVHEARLFLNAQPSKFISESSRLFGPVLREAGQVVPSTFEVVATKVASSVTKGFNPDSEVPSNRGIPAPRNSGIRVQANGLRDGLRAAFFGFTTGGESGMAHVASMGRKSRLNCLPVFEQFPVC